MQQNVRFIPITEQTDQDSNRERGGQAIRRIEKKVGERNEGGAVINEAPQ